MNRRWSYKLVEVKPSFLGLKSSEVEEALNQLGLQGWELVSVANIGMTIRLYMKKEQ